MKLVIGLGNPGRRFTHSRHNLGFTCVDLLAKKWGINIADRRSKAVVGQGQLDSMMVVLAKPRTFMNHSGEGVAYLLTRFALKPKDLVIIYDDMDLPLGKLRIRPTGSAAGHNGISSIISALASYEFPRIRVGIGRPPLGTDEVSFVLGSFTQEEKKAVDAATLDVVEAVGCLLSEDISTAMNKFN